MLYPCGANQTYDDVIVDGLNAADDHGIRGVGHRFTLRNSEVRNIRDQKGFEGGADDMLFENNYWHHITLVTGGVHNECMYVNGGNRSVYRGNLFLGCPTMALFFTNWDNGRPYRDVTIENNIFGHTLDEDRSGTARARCTSGRALATRTHWSGGPSATTPSRMHPASPTACQPAAAPGSATSAASRA